MAQDDLSSGTVQVRTTQMADLTRPVASPPPASTPHVPQRPLPLLPTNSRPGQSGAPLNPQGAQYQSQSDRFAYPTHRLRTAFSSGSHDGRSWISSQFRNLIAFFIATWLDWFCILVIGATAAGVWVAPHTFTRLIAVTDPTSGTIYWPELAYPYLDPVFSATAAGIIAALIPIASFLLAQLWQHSFVDFSSAVLGQGYSMVTATCFQVILKKTIGGLRPHFLAVCQPVVPAGLIGQGYQNIMYTAEQICTGDPDKVKNALESFPSGHATIAFSGFGYLAIYLFCHLKISSPLRRRGSHWKLLVVIAPLLLATYLTSTLVLGYHHHPGDVFFGAFIGWVMAFLGYRTVFRGILDPRWNTEPYLVLPPGNGAGDEGKEKEIKSSDTYSKRPTNGTVLAGRDVRVNGQDTMPV